MLRHMSNDNHTKIKSLSSLTTMIFIRLYNHRMQISNTSMINEMA